MILEIRYLESYDHLTTFSLPSHYTNQDQKKSRLIFRLPKSWNDWFSSYHLHGAQRSRFLFVDDQAHDYLLGNCFLCYLLVSFIGRDIRRLGRLTLHFFSLGTAFPPV